MDGKYLAEARREMWKAKEGGVAVEEHLLRSLAALTEAHSELVTRMERIEGGREWPDSPTTPEDP